jgi:hydroxymethylpyrimidine pyrophosphatase-like HAD family hydrolase
LRDSAGQGWRPRLVALDVDGTVVDRNGLLPPTVAEAVALVVQARTPVVLSTGRSWHGTKPVFEELSLPPGPTVCSNGAVIVRYPPQEIIKAITFDPRPVITQVEEFAPGSLIAVEEIGRGYRLNSRFPGDDLTGELIIEDAEQLSSRPVTRVIVRDPTRSDEDFVTLARHLGLHGVTYFVGWSAWLDIAPEGVNKATGLAEVAAGFGVSAADVLAFGDGRNDIEMLRWAGRGVAMGDAPDEVKAAADDVTESIDRDGPAAELRDWFG